MKERVVYLGVANNHKQEELIDRSVEYLNRNRGDRFYYLLPNEKLLKKYRREFINRVESTFEINLFTFDDIVDRILRGIQMDKIDNPMKSLIIRKILRELKEDKELIYYGDFIHMDGFIHSVNDIIGEIRRSIIYPEDYLKRCPNKAFYREMGIIYREYEKFLDKYNLVDREGEYLRSIDLLADNEILDDIDFIIIDEFYDFRPIELVILRKLIEGNMDIYINMPFDMKNRPEVLEDTLNVLVELGFTVEYISKEENTFFERIAFNLFGKEEKKLGDVDDKLRIINAPTPYLELKRICEEIVKLNNLDVDFTDIGIILTNPEYLEPLFKLAIEWQIPIDISSKLSLVNIPIIKELLNIIENRMTNGSKPMLINRIKSKYFSISDEEKKGLYEYIVRRQDFKDLDGLKMILDDNRELNVSLEQFQDLRDIVETLDEEFLGILEKDHIKNYNDYIKALFDEFQIVKRVIGRYGGTGKEDLFLRDMRSIHRLYEILDKLEDIPFLDKDISLEDYYFILEDYLNQEEIIEFQGKLNGISILNPLNSRGMEKKFIFITGLSQGSYPILDNGNYFINDHNIDELRYIGIDTKSYIERMGNEILKFSSIVSLCSDRMYLSYSRGYEDTGIPSIFLDELLGLFSEEEIEDISLDIGLDYLIERYVEPWKLPMIEDKIKGELERDKKQWNNYSGLLSQKEIVEDIHRHVNDIFSISYLESYSRCPYYFMMNNLLNVEEMERNYEEYIPMDIGMIYHEVLRYYYQYHLKDIQKIVLDGHKIDLEHIHKSLKDIVYRYSRQYGINQEKKKDLLIIESILDRLTNFIAEDLARLHKWRCLPQMFEVSFGNSKDFVIDTDNKKVHMMGRIDRIDRFVDEEKYIILDYKSSSYGIRDIDNMREGLSLQLPVYIMSQKDKDIIAGGYGIINSGKMEAKLAIIDETNIVTKRNKGALSKKEWNELLNIIEKNIVEMVENIEKGNFIVNPIECSPYCIYRNICRYEDVMEVE